MCLAHPATPIHLNMARKLLDEEITPKLDNLRAEKRSYLAYQKACAEQERLTRLLKAYQWHKIQEQIETQGILLQRENTGIDNLTKSIKELERQMQEAEKQKNSVEKRRDKEIEKGGRLRALEAEVESGEKELARFSTQVEIKQSSIVDEQKKVSSLEANLEEVICSP